MDYYLIIRTQLMYYTPRLIGSILLFIIGSWIIKKIGGLAEFYMNKIKLDVSLFGFFSSLIRIGLKMVLFITIASIMTIPMTTFIAVLSAVSLAVGIALKDSLSNLAGGILILMIRPFGVGDFIEFQGSIGTVIEIQLLHTSFNTPDNRRVIIPNGDLMTNKLINYTKESTRRIDISFYASYSDDVEHVKATILSVIQEHKLILKDPAPQARVMRHGDSAIEYVAKVWCSKDDYWTVHHDLHELVIYAFNREGITVPFPQRVVYQGETLK